MTQFRDGFMMKSPLPKHQQKFLDKARKLSEKSGTPGDYNRDDPKVNELLDKAEEAEKSHKNDGPIKMATASYRRTPMDTETYYGGEIDVPDITSVGKLAGYGIDSAVGAIFGGKGGAKEMRDQSQGIRDELGAGSNQCGPGTKMENGQCVPE
jgi:hypothetical protein